MFKRLGQDLTTAAAFANDDPSGRRNSRARGNNFSLLCETVRRSARTPRHQGGVFFKPVEGLDLPSHRDGRGWSVFEPPSGSPDDFRLLLRSTSTHKMETLAHPSLEKISYAAMPRRITAKCGSAAQSNSFKPFSRASRDTEFVESEASPLT